MPAEIVTYDPVTNTAFVRPLVKHALYKSDGERVFEDYPEIPFVPVIWPRAGGMMLTLPLEPGDTVLLVFAESSLAEWRTTGQISEQQDARRHSLGWPVAIPGLFPDTKPPAAGDAVETAAGAAIFGQDGDAAQMLVGGTVSGIRFGKLAVSPIALSVPTDAALSTIVTAINALISTLNALISAYNTHTHPVPGVTAGAASTNSTATTATVSPAAAGPSAPATTGSTLVKSV